MKKRRNPGGFMKIKSSTTLLTMKFLCLFFLLSLQLSAVTYSQKTKLTFKWDNISLIEALSMIREKSDYTFVYNIDDIERIRIKAVHAKNASIDEALQLCLHGTGFTYLIEDSVVVIQPEATRQADERIIVKGKIMDKDSVAIPGATIRLKGTNLGTSSDREGRFLLAFPVIERPVLIFSFIGMKTREIAYTNQEFVNVIMAEEVVSLEDVVVTGYANIRKESFTGSSTKVTREQLMSVSQQNLIKALEVFDPGFKIIKNNVMGSDPNTLPEYYIRGRSGTSQLKDLDAITSSDVSQFALVNNPSAPIFILDGFEVRQEAIYDMDMNRIESVTILKDAAATAVYGARAANGVIVIETVAPRPGEIRVSYSANAAVTIPDLSSYDLLNAREMLEAEVAAGYYTGTSHTNLSNGVIAYSERLNKILRGVDTDWSAKALKTQVDHKHTFSLGGGSQEVRWELGVNYNNRSGVMKESFRETYGANLTIDYRWKSMQIKNQVGLAVMSSENSPYGSFSSYVRMKPYLEPYTEDGLFNKVFSITYSNQTATVNNPLYEASLGSFDREQYTEMFDNLSVRWESGYWLVNGQFRLGFVLTDLNKFLDPASGTYLSTSTNALLRGKLSSHEIRSTQKRAIGSASYVRSINNNNINLAFGVDIGEKLDKALYSYYEGFANGRAATIANAVKISEKPTYRDANTRSFSSYLLCNYSFKDIYLADISARAEGSTAFGTKKKIGEFWSLGAGINLHKYAFMQEVGFVNQLKLSTTYGQTGKANFNPYQARSSYSVLIDQDYATNMGMVLKSLGNEYLKWEKKREWNFRGQVELFGRRVSLDANLYSATTLDMVEEVSIRSSSGFTSYMGNIGEVLNSGYEFSLTLKPVETRDVDVFVIWNGNHNKNEIKKIGTALNEYNARVDAYFTSGGAYNTTNTNLARPFTKYEEGNSLSAIYGMKSLGIDPARGFELYVKRDGTVTHTWSAAEQQTLGETEPLLSGALQFNVRWKNLTLYTAFLYNFGGQAYNQTYPTIENVDLRRYGGDRRILTDRWKAVGDVTPLKRIDYQTYQTLPTSRFVQDDNTIEFASLSIGYDFSRELIKRWGLNSLRLQFNMEDIATISSIKQERGTSFPFSHAFNLGLNMNF
ncbi:MAG: SusC/RagA family TonB-linked outer membrane protein [Odoribacteraceae bacterium]|jgi:TonB-linked SusC/RagA family outer membrane protein|nr:SusC/RagA family TonB-linked outer membrane protein [Odoribacteraceae bacterium]